MQDEVEKPDHYQFGSIEAWDIIELAVMDIADPVAAYHVASALKYLLRAARKGGDTDIAKASAHLKRETARHATATPDYDPASVAFRHGLDVHPCDLSTLRGRTAPEIADADGVSEYGNPVTPGCAMPSADDKTHGVFDVDLTRTAFFHTTDGVYHTYAKAWRP